MDTFSLIYIVVLFASLIVSLFICGFVRRLRHEDLSRYFFHFMLMVVYTSFAFLVYQLVLSQPVALFWAKARYLGIAGAGLLLLRFVFAYTNRPDWLKLRRLWLLLIVPILVQCVIWIPSLTHFFRSDWAITLAGLNTESGIVGPWFQIHVLSTTTYIIWGLVLLGQQAVKTVGIFRWQAITLMSGATIAVVSGYSYLLPGKLPPFLPIGLTIMSVMIAVALFRLLMVDLVPIARDTVFDQIADIVFVLDMQHRIIDLNHAALRMLPGYTRADLIGKATKQVFAAFPEAIEHFYNLEQTHEVVMSRDHERSYDLRISPIYRQKQPVGRLVILQNITQRTQAERRLRENENLFTTILNMALEAIISINENQKIIQFNEGAERIFGYRAAEVLGVDIGVLLPEHLMQTHTGSIHEFLASSTNSRYMGERQEVFGRRRSGELFPAEASISKIKQGEQFIMTVVMRDITERKRAQQTLIDSEKRLRIFAESVPARAVVFDRAGNYRDVLKHYHRIGGIEVGDTKGKNIRDIAEDYFADYCTEMIRKTLDTNQRHKVEYNYTTNDKIYYYEGYLAPFKDIDTDEQLVVWIAFDITERKAMEVALRESERRYRGLFEQTYDAVFIFSLDLHFLEANQRALDMLGYQAHEFIGKPTSMVIAPYDYPQSLNTVQALQAGEQIAPFERVLRRKDGSEFPVEISLSLAHDAEGQPLHFLSVTRDITERKQIEQVIHEREKRFRSLIEKSSDLVITVDRTGTITYVSPASRQVTTYDETEMLGHNILEIFIPSPLVQVDEQIKQHVRQMLANSVKDNIQLETQITGKDGQAIWLRGILTNLLDDPDIGAIVANIHNVTELKQAIAKEQQESSFVKVLLELATIQGEAHNPQNVLERILAQLSMIFPNDGINIMLMEDAIGKIVAVSGYSAEKASHMMQHQVNFRDFPTFQHILHTKKPLLVSDTKSNPIWVRRDISEDANCYLGVPIILSNKVIGIINLHHHAAHSFNDEMASRIYAIASYIAVVIHNFQAYEDVKVLAIQEERQHLARELHDAVSQTLFSASMISETLPRLLDHDVDTVRDGLEELTTLTKGALAEMRLLLIELRPSALREITLHVLLDNLINGFKARIADAEVEVDLKCDTNDLSLDFKSALYRVAQEALSNVMKHARPKHVRIMCHCQTGKIDLFIADDGIGFNPEEILPTQFGLRIMRERAEQAGLTLVIESQPGSGTVTRLSGQF